MEASFHKNVDFDAAIRLFTDENTTHLVDRQISTLDRVSKDNAKGFHIDSLPSVLILLKESIKKLQDGEERFLIPVCALLEIACLPFNTGGATTSSKSSVGEFMEGICSFLNSPFEILIITALETLRCFSEKNNNVLTLNKCGATEKICSLFVVHVQDEFITEGQEAALFSAPSNDNTTTTTIAPVVLYSSFILKQYLSTLSNIGKEKSSNTHLQESLFITSLITILAAPLNIKDEVIHLSVDIVWSLVDHASSAPDEEGNRYLIDSIASTNFLQTLQVKFKSLLLEGYRKGNKELRNSLLVIFNKIGKYSSSSSGFIETGLLETVLSYNTAPEAGLEMSLNTRVHNYDTSDDQDFEFKILRCLIYMCVIYIILYIYIYL